MLSWHNRLGCYRGRHPDNYVVDTTSQSRRVWKVMHDLEREEQRCKPKTLHNEFYRAGLSSISSKLMQSQMPSRATCHPRSPPTTSYIAAEERGQSSLVLSQLRSDRISRLNWYWTRIYDNAWNVSSAHNAPKTPNHTLHPYNFPAKHTHTTYSEGPLVTNYQNSWFIKTGCWCITWLADFKHHLYIAHQNLLISPLFCCPLWWQLFDHP